VTKAAEQAVEQSRVQPTNGELLAAVLAKFEEVLNSQAELLASHEHMLATVKRQGDELVELRQRLSFLETPPTKAMLVEQLRERDAEIALLRQRIADLETSRA
jgi:predicted nuclease with TOPRIM domain